MSKSSQISSVLTIGNTLLHRAAREVTKSDKPLVRDAMFKMKCTVDAIGERVGLAATQIGIPLKIILVRSPDQLIHPRYKAIFD